MARELWSFQVTIPAGTAVSAPFTQSTTIPVRTPDAVEIIVPPGPSGLMGFAITMGGVNVIPVAPRTFIVTDDEKIHWPISSLPDSGAWEITGYNVDVFDHAIYLRWLVDVVGTPESTPVDLTWTLADLSS